MPSPRPKQPPAVPYASASPSPIPWWNRRGVVAVVCTVGTLAGALAYAGPAAPVVALRLLGDGLVLAAWMAAATGLGSLAWPWWAGADADGHDRSGRLIGVVTAAALGLGAFSLAVLGLGLLGWLNRATSIALVAIGLAAGGWRVFRLFRGRRLEPVRPARADGRAALWAWLVVVPFAAIALVGTMVPPGLLWKPTEPLGYDVVEYHLQAPREWYEAGRIVALPHNAFSYFPFNVEMHYLLAMHLDGGPWEGMFLAQLMHAAMVALFVAAAAGFAARLAAGRTAAVVAGVAVACVPWLTQLAAIAYNEGGFLLYSTLSVGWALWATIHPHRRVRHYALAGAMAGLACGTKLTALPEVLIGVPVVSALALLARRLRNHRDDGRDDRLAAGLARRDAGEKAPTSPDGPGPGWSDLLGPIVWFPLVGSLLFAPWLVRNAAWTGNPVFPEGTGVFGGGHFSDVQVERWRHAHSPRPDQKPLLHFVRDPATGDRVAQGRLAEGWRQVLGSWQFGYALVPLGVLAAVLARRRPATPFLVGVLLLLTLFWFGFTHLQGRFYLLALPACAILLAQVSWGRRATIAILGVVVLAAIPGWFRLHRAVVARLYGEPNGPGGVVAVVGGPWAGDQNISWVTADTIEGLPPDAPLLLVGDAQAFWYPLPMSRLRYRTVFDADTGGGRGIREAWGVGHGRPGEWVAVAPDELERFRKYYQPFPDPPAEWQSLPQWEANRPFLLRPDGKSVK